MSFGGLTWTLKRRCENVSVVASEFLGFGVQNLKKLLNDLPEWCF